ncbi:uncharacterized protein I303_105718 [Kwoniella dejecticola CBS 10117]|uniref:D-xylose 1-dehydrogenase (NADP(+), D-xylono-1,5-lactone-forming) n=1 Tax=Kwoniella dejecticola CBS 10117 TaxID=1296121 RepID=A0A1A6A079_9TREE|nr:dimeric dihydrodiol dehydrogenase [Kwoniella dejecticola CBS 10117]OBR83460.1 dimeric dihydrodiol dehydrogenase [Kwoniella dejecticola CBS 10117]
MSFKPFVAQWGIIGCGWISTEFVQDICRPPSSRGVKNISHAVAAAGSRNIAKAQGFLDKNCPQGAAAQQDGLVDFKPKAYGSYKGVVEDPNVNIVYIGTMNVCHYDDAKLALEGGKHVLLEKPATLNAAEWRSLVSIAKEKNLFLMEAVWTRFNPVLLAIQKAIHQDNVIGDIRCLYSDLSMDSLGKRADTDRLLSAELAGGPLLDLGPYPLVWTMMMLYRHPKNERTPPAKIGSTMMLHHTGVDVATNFALTFPKITAMANCTANLLSPTQKSQHTRIVGSEGEILVQGITSRPQSYIIRRLKDPSKEGGEYLEDELVDMSFEEGGLVFEADHVARCLKDGLIESKDMPWDETELTMSIFDQIRKEGGYKFLPGLEKVQLD